MSTLQCLDAVKNRRTRVPSTANLRLQGEVLSPVRLPRKQATNAKKLYEVEVVEEKGALVKVHYTGYSSHFDEWKPKEEVVLNKPNFQKSTEQEWSAVTELACSIKKRLLPSRSEDPEVRIQIPCDGATFRLLQSKGVAVGAEARVGSSQEKYTISSYSDYDELLGQRWHIRVVNPVGDFSYVILKTVCFYLTKGRPILDYEVSQNEDGTLDLEPTYIEQLHSLIFTFVRGDGNKKDLLNFI